MARAPPAVKGRRAVVTARDPAAGDPAIVDPVSGGDAAGEGRRPLLLGATGRLPLPTRV